MSQSTIPVTIAPVVQKATSGPPPIQLTASDKCPGSYSIRVPQGFYASIKLTDNMKAAVSGGKDHVYLNAGAYISFWVSKYPPKTS